jgi:ornithine carbamoyltransferase
VKKDLLTLWDLEAEEILSLLNEARALKGAGTSRLLDGKTVALVFEKASTRTKVSFAVAAYRLGAKVVTLDQGSSQLGRGETYADTARVLSQYVDGIVLRTFDQRNAEEMAEFASIPVINGLSDMYHPCQVLADLLTVQEEKGDIQAQTVAWVGDGNNMCHSWIVAATRLGFHLQIATPAAREPDPNLLARVRGLNAAISLSHRASDAVQGADVINTDTWESMGQEGQAESEKLFAGFQLDDALLGQAKPDAIVLHCLPAHRGHEISASVIDGPQSRVWQEAGNRLWVQQAILARYLIKQKP